MTAVVQWAKSDISSMLTSSGANCVISHPLPDMHCSFLTFLISSIDECCSVTDQPYPRFLSSLCLSVSLPLSAIGVPELAVRVAYFESSARQIKIAEAGVWT